MNWTDTRLCDLLDIERNWGNLPGFGKAPIPCQQARPFCNE